MPVLRPMRGGDVAAVHQLAAAGFADLERRLHEPPQPPGDPAAAHVRIRRLLDADPAGAWVADDGDGGLAGVALAVLREGVWGLSLLVVRPGLQSAGLGTALLRRSLEYAEGARGAIILGSPDPRALRAYGRAGFALHPAFRATGRPRDVVAAPEVRPFIAADAGDAAAIDRRLRGAAHGADLDAFAAAGCELLAYPGRGYAVRRGGELRLLAAADEEAAAALLRTVLARATADAEVEWLTSAQQWAIDVVLDARLELRAGGAVCLRGEVGPFSPYLPSGAYL